METSPDSIEGMTANEGLGKLGMIPVDLWRRVLPAERVVLGRCARSQGQKWSEWASLRRL